VKHIDISELSDVEDLGIHSVFAMNQYWRDGQCFVMKNPRPQSALLWFCGCSATFVIKDRPSLEIPQNALVYIPQESVYSINFKNIVSAPSTVLVEFCLKDTEPLVLSNGIKIIFPSLDDGYLISIIKKLVGEFSLPSRPNLKIRRNMYDILSILCELEKCERIQRKGLKIIEKGIEYLQKDEKQELSVEEIAKMCFVTPAYFRRLFKEYSGLSPTEYRNKLRVERAKVLLEHSDMSIEAVSTLLGYSDPSYFCRVFKKEVGISPSRYLKNKD